jgi:hypothetical protein
VDRPRRLAIPLLVRFSAMTTTTIGNLGGGYPRPSAYVRLRRQVRELGETDMASMALATLDLVTHDDAQPAFPAVHLEDQTVLSYGEMAGLVGEFERVLRHDARRWCCATVSWDGHSAFLVGTRAVALAAGVSLVRRPGRD